MCTAVCMLVVLTREVWGVSVTWVKVSVMTRCPWCVCVLEVLILWTRWCRAKPRRINSMHWLIWLPWQPLPWPLYDVNNSWRDKPSQTHTQTQSHTHTPRYTHRHIHRHNHWQLTCRSWCFTVVSAAVSSSSSTLLFTTLRHRSLTHSTGYT